MYQGGIEIRLSEGECESQGAFNCTKEELKEEAEAVSIRRYFAFNCTIQKLKPIPYGQVGKAGTHPARIHTFPEISVMKNKLIVFAGASFVCGTAGFLGSILGHAFSQAGVFAGAIIGGIIGLVSSILLFVQRKLIEANQFLPVVICGLLFFGVAILFALTNLNTPVIPLISLSFAGLGCIAGKSFRFSRGQKRSFYHFTGGFVAMLPALYFVTGSVVKYNLGFSQSFSLFGLLEHSPGLFRWFNLFSPFVFIGGTLLCIALNAPVRFTREPSRLFSLRYDAGWPKPNLFMSLAGCTLVLSLTIYGLLENL